MEKIGMTAFIVDAEDVFSNLCKASKDDWATTSSVSLSLSLSLGTYWPTLRPSSILTCRQPTKSFPASNCVTDSPRHPPPLGVAEYIAPGVYLVDPRILPMPQIVPLPALMIPLGG